MLRSLLISSALFFVAIGLHSYLSTPSVLRFSQVELAILIREKMAWFGALLGATYAALYSRFSSQWRYLADLYNQLMAAEDARPRNTLAGEWRRRRILWWHAFITDAKDLHLALKPSFATAIWTLLKEEDIAAVARGNSFVEAEEFFRFLEELQCATQTGGNGKLLVDLQGFPGTWISKVGGVTGGNAARIAKSYNFNCTTRSRKRTLQTRLKVAKARKTRAHTRCSNPNGLAKQRQSIRLSRQNRCTSYEAANSLGSR
jgi:hypothetical protein